MSYYCKNIIKEQKTQWRFMDQKGSHISEVQFEAVFKSNFKALHHYAAGMLQDADAAEDVVQQVFVKLWEKRQDIDITTSLNAYLYRMVHNGCLNALKHEKVKTEHVKYVARSAGQAGSADDEMAGKQLSEKIQKALQRLPEQCRTIFQLSRFEELKYREIAEKLQLSVKTIENQMGKALKIMREELAPYLTIWFAVVALTALLKMIFLYQ